MTTHDAPETWGEWMRAWGLGLCLCAGSVGLLWAAVASAQSAQQPAPSQAAIVTPSSHLGWTIVGETPALAQAATYRLYVDVAPVGLPVTGVACVVSATAPADSECQGNWPAMTIGTHTVTVTQMDTSGAESPKSLPLTLTWSVTIIPTGLKIVP